MQDTPKTIKIPKAEYDIFKANKHRRTPKRETAGEGVIYDPSKRSYGVNIGRDLERNYSPARGILHQFRMNVAGSLGKIQINTAGGEEAASWFNGTWAKDCDYRDGMHWSEVCQNIVAAVLREGDLCCVFDDGMIEDSGKLLFWEADQIVPVSDSIANAKFPGSIQDGGIIRNKWGKILAYAVTGKRGQVSITDEKDVTFFPADVAILPRNPWRLSQGRGVPTIITAASSLLDVYEMLMRELQTAKKAATQYAFVKRDESVMDWDNPAAVPTGLPENDGKSATTTGAEGANSATNPEARNFEALESFTGGYTDYGDSKDSIEYPPVDRPNNNMIQFIESVQCHAGAAFGMARAYTLMRADSSYTSFRGDMIMTWASAFLPMQKWLERRVADWVGIKAIKWAIGKGMIKALPEGWEKSISWTWPTMPEVNQVDAENAIALGLKNGTTDYSQLLGPDWRKRLEGLAEQIEVIRSLGIPLSVLEMKSGGTAEKVSDGNDADDKGMKK